MSGIWRNKRTRRLATIIGAAVAALVIIAAFVLVWRMTAPRRVSSQPPAPSMEEAEPTTESAPASSAIAALPVTASVEPSPSAAPSETPVFPSTPGARIAYRLGPNLYVADENGSNAVAVALAPSGDYTLSPDARTIAVVDGDTKQLVFLDIASRTLVESTIVSGGRPVWMPDSSGVLVATLADVNGGTRIQRVPRVGGGPTAIAMGGMAAVSPDAGTLVVGPGFGASAAESKQISVVRAGRAKVITAPGAVTSVAATNDRVFFGTMDEKGAGVWSVPATGGTPKALVPVAVGSPYVALMLSPNAASIAFAAGGDDGYSRVSVVSVTGGSPTKLWLRRDDYVLQWSTDSAWVFLIEGNAFQGESTSLYRVGHDGRGRRLIAEGASL